MPTTKSRADSSGGCSESASPRPVRPPVVARKSAPLSALDRAQIRLLSEHGAIPVDLLARLVRRPVDDVLRFVARGIEFGWLRSTEYPTERYDWILLRLGGVKLAGTGFGIRERPCSGQLEHRREVLEVRVLLEEEKPGWRWICERTLRGYRATGRKVPDAVLQKGDERWAIEVEQSKKEIAGLVEKLELLCAEYDRVIYFYSAKTRGLLQRLKRTGRFPNLHLRCAPGKKDEPVRSWPVHRDSYLPGRRARWVLNVLSKEGAASVAQLPRLLGWKPSEVTRVLEELEQHGCIRRGYEVQGDGGWVWCTYRGSARSGTELRPLKMPSRGSLLKRLVLMEIRLDVFAIQPAAVWRTKRELLFGYSNAPPGTPRAVVELGGLRYAVCVLESRPNPKTLLALFEQWHTEYTGVLCYRTAKLARWADRLIEDHGLEGVEVRDIPKPPESSPYRTLEDEWRTGREPYEPTSEELRLLRLASTEGLISMAQLPDLLGCDAAVAGQLVASLESHNCLQRDFGDDGEGGWIRCNGRGIRMSETGLARAKVPLFESLDQRLVLMEIRLDLARRFSSIVWATRREIARGLTAHAGVPQAGAMLNGKWHAIGFYSRGQRTKVLVKLLRQWSGEHRRVMLFCEAEDVDHARKMLTRYELDAVKAVAYPELPDWLRAYRRRLASMTKAEKQRVDERQAERVRACRAVASAVRSGRLIKPSKCRHGHAVESPVDLHAHHVDYSNPLEVEWLCRKCHDKKHKPKRRPSSRGCQKPTRARGKCEASKLPV